MRITLEISAGPEAGRKLWLAAGQSLVIGRTQMAEFSVPSDAQMSSVHFQIAWIGQSFLLRDLKSTNGTTRNGERIQETTLCSGDIIVAGGSTFTVLLEGENVQSIPTSPTGPIRPISLVSPITPVPPTQSVSPPAVAGPTDDEPLPLLQLTNCTPFSAIYLPWQNAEGFGRLTVIVKATFRFTESEVTVAERQLPIWFADQHEEGDPLKPVRFEADTAPFKPRADVVLVGKAYLPGGRPRTSVDVRLRVGGLNQRLRVFGDRRWLFPTRLAVVPQMTDPVPFTEMPLTYTRAFGGIDQPAARYCAENLSGVGFIGEPSPASIHDKPLPNIEHPEHLIGGWDTRPKPVGFGFYGRGWQPRLKYLGTYDEAYRRNRSPRQPEDFSYDVYNGAHADLQVAGYLDGDEVIELENLTRDGNAKFKLPGIRLRITLTRYVSPATNFEGTSAAGKVNRKTDQPGSPVLDSLVIVPDDHLFYAVFRAVFAVQDIENPAIAEITIE